MNRALYRSLEISQLLHVLRRKSSPKSGSNSDHSQIFVERLLKDAQRLVVVLQMIICKRIINYRKFLSKSARRRKPNLIRQLTEAYAKNPEFTYFASGMLNNQLIPFKQISVTFEDNTEEKFTETEIYSAFQYGLSKGYPPLIKKWRGLQKKWHLPQYHEWDIHFTSGSMDGCSKIFDMVLDEGQPVMVQSPTHPAILGSVLSKSPYFIPINMDEHGVLPDEIDRFCNERLLNEKSVPKILYVNPTGANPVGIVYTVERKKEIYKLAQKYDFLILEDDPCYFLHYLKEQPISFFSLDVDGRVLRLDSFSKIVSPGLRLGSVTGPRPLLAKLSLHIQSSTLHASSVSQLLIYKLLQNRNDNLESHFMKIQEFYKNRRNYMHSLIKKHFSELAEWSLPSGGLFFWIKIKKLDINKNIFEEIIKKKTFVVPGCEFYQDSSKPCQYLRLSFSTEKLDDFEEGISKLATAIKNAAIIKNKIT